MPKTLSLKCTCFVVASLITLASCSSLKDSPKYLLGHGDYEYRQKGTRFQKTIVYIEEDTLAISKTDGSSELIVPNINAPMFFLRRSFDIDVMTVGFKYRPTTLNLPRQLTTDFNGNLYLGYRHDRFRIDYKKTPFGRKLIHHHRAITIGVFGGVGSTSVTPWTTNNLTTDEYNAFTLSRGFAAMVGINSLTVGLGIGWDYITDRDKNIWIYQNKPWYGLTIGLNIN